ncbi:ABC transporter permease [Anaerosporobacter faecicola]|uniref:ABC transporter permease n=1 Tax=Anaerosporobacter faecicola TaxID=2718714 RepID=UPI00143B8998|nr:ABC transporter permease [Anaerosporobacter faecicola]
MNIMNSLTWKHMKSNKKRTIVTILGVIISVAMITGVSTAALTFTTYIQKIQMKQSGEWHFSYENITKDQAMKAADQVKNKFHYYTQVKGYSKWNDGNNSKKPYIYVEAYDEVALDKMPIKIIDGRLPEKNDEIIISKEICNQKDKALKLGDQISFEYGCRYGLVDGIEQELSQGFEYQDGSEPGSVKEDWKSTGEKQTCTIVGIMESRDQFITPGRTAFAYLDMDSLSNSAQVSEYFFLDKVTNSLYDDCLSSAEKIDIEKEQIAFHDSLLRLYGVSRYEDTYNKMIRTCSFILILIIMVGSVALIYNSFAISINERSKQFGMLASIGATKEQKRNAVLFEGAIVGAISIPLGILAGFVGMGITFQALDPLLKNALGMEVHIKLVVSLTSVIAAIIFSLITIFISAYLPARKAAKITPIEAIRQSKDITIKAKQVKTSRLLQFLLGIEGNLAIKNLKRNRKHYRALVFSLAISLILFISVGSYVFYLKDSVNFSMENESYDVALSGIEEKDLEPIADILVGIPSFKEGNSIAQINESIPIDEEQRKNLLSDELKDRISEDQTIGFSLFFIDDNVYEKIVNHNSNTTGLHAILINQQMQQKGYSLTEMEPTNAKKGDTITVREKDIHLDLVTKERAMGVYCMQIGGNISLVLPMKELKEFQKESDEVSYSYYLNTTSPSNVEDEIVSALLQKNISSTYAIYNQANDVIRNNQITTVFSVFAYGFITLISLICIANLFNTISTSFALRRREFAMLKSIGMTPQVFRRMIQMESLMYGIKACLFGVPISIGMTLWIKKAVSYNFTRSYQFPIMTYVVGIAAVFVVVGVAMLYSGRKVRKENIVEGLKTEVN